MGSVGPVSPPSDGTPTATSSPGVTPAVGNGAQLGDSWVAAQIPGTADGRPIGRIEAVTAGGPGFVAVGRGCVNTGADLPTCEGVVWTSTDGKAWTRTPAGDPTDTGAVFPTSGPELGMFDVAAGGPGIVAIGYAARPNPAATIWFSSDDGVSWERAKIGDVGTTRVNAITWDGRQFVMVGEDRSQWDGTLEGMDKASARAAVWTSTDGYNFTRVPDSEVFDVGEFRDTMEDPSTGGMTDVVAGPAGLVAVGSVCTAEPVGCRPMAWTSADGITWERAVAMQAADDQGVSDAGGLTAVAASDDRYVAAAGNWVLTSTDGRTWARSSYLDGVGWGSSPRSATGSSRARATGSGCRQARTARTGPPSRWIRGFLAPRSSMFGGASRPLRASPWPSAPLGRTRGRTSPPKPW